jgi:hypothetical protein
MQGRLHMPGLLPTPDVAASRSKTGQPTAKPVLKRFVDQMVERVDMAMRAQDRCHGAAFLIDEPACERGCGVKPGASNIKANTRGVTMHI